MDSILNSNLKAQLLVQVVESLSKLALSLVGILIILSLKHCGGDFCLCCNWPSVLSLNNLKSHQTKTGKKFLYKKSLYFV